MAGDETHGLGPPPLDVEAVEGVIGQGGDALRRRRKQQRRRPGGALAEGPHQAGVGPLGLYALHFLLEHRGHEGFDDGVRPTDAQTPQTVS